MTEPAPSLTPKTSISLPMAAAATLIAALVGGVVGAIPTVGAAYRVGFRLDALEAKQGAFEASYAASMKHEGDFELTTQLRLQHSDEFERSVTGDLAVIKQAVLNPTRSVGGRR